MHKLRCGMVKTQTIEHTRNGYQRTLKVVHHPDDQFLFETTDLTDTKEEVRFNDNAINTPFYTFGKC